MTGTRLPTLLAEARACSACDGLPLGPRPVFQLGHDAKIVIIGQAPGRRAHESGVPFDDASGDRLRRWLGVDRATFLDPARIAVLPMGFCFPGTGSSGDLPPRPECAPLWHPRLLEHVADDALILILGMYALARYLPEHRTVTAAAKAWHELLPTRMALPHPSPRNNRWLRNNPWFETDAVPALQARVAKALDG